MKHAEKSEKAERKEKKQIGGYARGGFLVRSVAALLSGTLLGLSFPSPGWDLLAWIAFVPLLTVPLPRNWGERILVGFIFGYTHFAFVLHWLNEVGFGAGWILAFYCALFPMLWYVVMGAWYWRLKDPKTLNFPGSGPLFLNHDLLHALSGIVAASTWVGLEWIRSWLFTGFPWDQLGISQYHRMGVVQLSAFTGVYGISFLILVANVAVTAEVCHQIRFFIVPTKRGFPFHWLLLSLCLIPVCYFGHNAEIAAPAAAPVLKAVAVQGDIPQCREWTQEQFNLALNTYVSQSLAAKKSYPDTELFVWPECAVPSTVDYEPYRAYRTAMARTLQTPLLAGALEQRQTTEKSSDFNSAFLFDANGNVLDTYDKMHLVPFGEYVPFGDQFPWLRETIGMGRDLTAGRDAHLFELPKGARAGVNICFEDAFPEISRAFTLRGANILMTITNDSWYGQSCGAEQHASHLVFRAVENRRPVLRSGNNSHTFLVTPNGRILGKTPSFQTAWQAYEIPVWNDWGETFYTLHGDIFAKGCAIAAGLTCLYLFFCMFFRKSRQLDAIEKAR